MRVVFISSMLPSGHFSQIITSGLAKVKNLELIVYTDKDKKNLTIKNCGKIKLVWSKSLSYFTEILNELKVDKPDVVHIQQELNMYGGLSTVILFPWLLLAIRLQGIKVVTTLHATVFKKQIDHEFIHLFNKDDSKIMQPFVLKLFFHYLFALSSLFSDKIIVHSDLTKQILAEDYSVDANKMNMIRTAIPEKKVDNKHKKQYFFYFGYMVRRKGLEHLIRGFAQFLLDNPGTPFKLVLAGGVIKGQEESFEEIKQFIKDLYIEDKVEIKGYIEEKEQDKLYQQAYVVAIPAVLSMGSSGPLYHSLSYGKCVIATKMGHFLYDLKDKKTGVLTENSQWASALTWAVNNPDLVEKIEENTLKERENRTPYRTALKYVKVYTSAIIPEVINTFFISL